MGYFLLIFIRIYWLIPVNKRKRCIFKESCSKYVYRITKKSGLKAGIEAILDRRAKCRPGYYYITDNLMRLADNSLIDSNLLNERIL
ncbi:MAG: membrane protein insertion efficiency factor YidD [Bacteroidetes bacterium]|nr:membrane protein insertion efficiency factor YidD [Bacteroidota bacterium]